MGLAVGQVLLNKYQIDRLLGEGGFGCVYAATELRLNMRVAIKELRAELAGNREMLERFVNEARAIAALNNPHIVRVLSYDQEGSHHYIVLEFMDGGSLTELIKKRGKLKLGEAAWITQAVCDGLAAAHRMGIVHRDIKPANILLMKDGQTVKISDFGIAHVPQQVAGGAGLTRTGMTMGTAWYMSPEQARGQKVDARGDLYSVGVMLYDMVAGYTYLEFTSDFLADVERLKTQPPRPLPGDVPAGLRQIIAKALVKEPGQRYQSAEEMAAALRTFIQPGGTVFIPSTDRARTVSRPPERVSPLPFIVGGTALVVMVVALLATALIGNWNRSTSGALPSAVPVVAQITAPTAGRDLAAGAQAMTAQATAYIPSVDTTAVYATAMANFEATQSAARERDAAVAATLTAVAPTATNTATRSVVPTASPTASVTPTPQPTATASPKPPHQFSAVVLISPQPNEWFKEESYAPLLQWRPVPDGPLDDDQWYRVQVYRGNEMGCNLYTKETAFGLPPARTDPCDPGIWKFNTGDWNWRVSVVRRVDGDRNHDIEIRNSEGRLFKWFKP